MNNDMPALQLFSFSDSDRSGKIRWTAAELGIPLKEERVAFADHRKAPYTDKNPFGHVPTATWQGETLLESTAICWALIDASPEGGLEIGRGEEGRQAFHFWLSLFTESFEGRLVECAVSKLGLLKPAFFELHSKTLTRKLQAALPMIPVDSYLCGSRFSLADICAGYSLRLALQCEFVEWEQVAPYMRRLQERPAAQDSCIFASIASLS